MLSKIKNKLLKELSYQTGLYTVAPEFLSLIMTMKCNFRCKSCSIWEKDAGAELDSDGWQKVIASLAEELGPRTFVEINGGEALIRKDLVISCIRELKKHFHKVALNSNGSLLDRETVFALKDAGLDTVKLSLYSLDKNIHDSLRGHESAFDQACRALENVRESGLALEIGLLITAENIRQAPALIEHLREMNGVSIILQPLDELVESAESKNLAGNALPRDLWPAADDVNAFFDFISANNKNIKNSTANIDAMRRYYLFPPDILSYRCFAGQRNLVIYPNGDAALCFKGNVLGNILETGAKNILMNAQRQRLAIKKCPKYCRIVGCNFSRGLKEYFSR
jgi:MoaA/NifB/PqqE/SkfB family radical SAM enzyme